MDFAGFGDGAFEFFERVQAQHSWAAVQLHREAWDREVHAPMEALLDQLGAEFGRDAYAYHLHKDPYLWSHQVGILTVVDTIGFRLVLSLDGLTACGGWLRSSPDQIGRYRHAVASEAGQQVEAVLARVREDGFAIEGKRLRRGPRGWPADRPRSDLLRYQTLYASGRVPGSSLASGPSCTEAVAASLRRIRPLTNWLADNVGPRQASSGRLSRSRYGSALAERAPRSRSQDRTFSCLVPSPLAVSSGVPDA